MVVERTVAELVLWPVPVCEMVAHEYGKRENEGVPKGGLLTCQSILLNGEPPLYPPCSTLLFSTICGCPSSSPMRLSMEKDAGRPPKLQLRLHDGSFKLACAV